MPRKRVLPPTLPTAPEGVPPATVKLLLYPVKDAFHLYVPFCLKVEFVEEFDVLFEEEEGSMFPGIDSADGTWQENPTPTQSAALEWSVLVWRTIYRELLTGGIGHLRLWALAAGIMVWQDDSDS